MRAIKHNRRATDPKCMATLYAVYTNVAIPFYCQRLKGHAGPHIHRGVGEERVYGHPTVNTNFNVAWMTKK